jgi:hypothetical protein
MAFEVRKILYVNYDIGNERKYRVLLENYCRSLVPPCTFTVISNLYTALEAIETTRFSLCFIQYDTSPRPDFDSRQFVLVAKVVAPTLQFVALLPESASSLIQHDGVFNGYLVDPQERDLRQAITAILGTAAAAAS